MRNSARLSGFGKATSHRPFNMPPPSKRRRIREFVDAGVDNNKFTGSTSKRMLLQRIVREYEEVVRASSAVGQRNSSKGLKELLKESNALFEKVSPIHASL